MIAININKQLNFSKGASDLHVNAVLQTGCITALYGSSGAGKTTLLKIIAGLVKPERGMIEVNGTTWLDTSRGVCLPPQQRSIGFVFQDYALFPNMTVQQNLLYAGGKQADRNFISELLGLVKMEAFLAAMPSQLSGGQQQRVAMIRALVRKPQLLLLDEPLSALDEEMRRDLRTELYNIQQRLQITAVLVSHDIGEVYSLAAHIIQLQQGKVVATGTPQQLFGAAALSSKLQLIGEILHVIPNGVINVLEISAGNTIICVAASDDEIMGLQIGDKVLVYAKAFNVGIRKMTV